jgi:hypothetical protein
MLGRMVPSGWCRTRVALSFFVLRPFDVVPTITNRLLAWVVVRARSRPPT